MAESWETECLVDSKEQKKAASSKCGAKEPIRPKLVFLVCVVIVVSQDKKDK